MTHDNITEFSCPVCMVKLVTWKKLCLETMDEHVCCPNKTPSLKNALVCPDATCPTRIHGIFWDEYEGGLYSENKISKDDIPFIDSNCYPFGSFNRADFARSREEKRLNRHIFTFPSWFPSILSKMKVYTNWTCSADNNGVITSKRFGLHWITKHGIIHIWGLRMFIYSVNRNIKAWNGLRKEFNSYEYRELTGCVERMEWAGAEWWRIWSGNIAKLMLKHLRCY